MGFIKDAKANTVKAHAERAVNEGRKVFVCRFDPGMSSKHGVSGSVSGVAEMIESVEAAGWKMDNFQTTSDHAIIGLYRR